MDSMYASRFATRARASVSLESIDANTGPQLSIGSERWAGVWGRVARVSTASKVTRGNTPLLWWFTCVRSGGGVVRLGVTGPCPLPSTPWHGAQNWVKVPRPADRASAVARSARASWGAAPTIWVVMRTSGTPNQRIRAQPNVDNSYTVPRQNWIRYAARRPCPESPVSPRSPLR